MLGPNQTCGTIWSVVLPHLWLSETWQKSSMFSVQPWGLGCLKPAAHINAQTTAIWGDYVTPESGTFFTHEQGRSLTETSMHLCKTLSFYVLHSFLSDFLADKVWMSPSLMFRTNRNARNGSDQHQRSAPSWRPVYPVSARSRARHWWWHTRRFMMEPLKRLDFAKLWKQSHNIFFLKHEQCSNVDIFAGSTGFAERVATGMLGGGVQRNDQPSPVPIFCDSSQGQAAWGPVVKIYVLQVSVEKTKYIFFSAPDTVSDQTLEEWKQGKGHIGLMTPKFQPQADLCAHVAPRPPQLKMCKMDDAGNLAIPREVRDKWLSDPVRRYLTVRQMFCHFLLCPVCLFKLFAVVFF